MNEENDSLVRRRSDDAPREEAEKKIVRWRVVQHSDGPTPRPRHGHRAVPVQDLMVVFGGGNEGMIEELHVYNTYMKRWLAPQIRGEIPSPAAAFGAVALGTKIYTFGGMVEYGKYTNEVYELQTTRWEWRRMNTRTIGNELPPAPRIGLSFVASEKTQKAYLFGGLCNDLNDNKRNIPRYMNDFYVLNLATAPSGVVWEKPQTHGTPPKPRESHSAVIYETDTVFRMVVYGGMDGVRLGDMWYMDLNTYQWTEIKFDDPRTGIPPMPRSLHSSVLIKEKMFVFGGWVPILPGNDDVQEKEWKCTDSLSCWDVSENRWIPLRQYSTGEGCAPRGRSGHCAAAMGDRMYIWSGRDGYRKAWSNQVCCRDMWLLETMKPEQPGKIQLERASFNLLEISWPPVNGVNGYFLQIGFGDPKELATTEKQGDEPPAKQAAAPLPENDAEKKAPGTTSMISTQGTTYTAPATSKPTTDESGLPQDLFEDTEKNEGAGTSASPKLPGEGGGSTDAKKPEEGVPEDGDTKAADIKKEVVKEQNEDDTLPWFDIGIVKRSPIKITHYFNENQQPIQQQLAHLIQQNALKCVNDPAFTPADKVPLINGQTYRFRVAAINGLGMGKWSETASFKTCVPGFPSAPSSIRITKSAEGAQLTWEPPANVNVSGKILEYSVYLAVKNQSSNPADSQLAFMRVYCGAVAECQVPQANLGTAYVDQTNKPAIIFRIAARNEKGYGPATQVRWLQDQQKLPPVRNNYPNVNPGYLYHHQGQKRRFDH